MTRLRRIGDRMSDEWRWCALPHRENDVQANSAGAGWRDQTHGRDHSAPARRQKVCERGGLVPAVKPAAVPLVTAHLLSRCPGHPAAWTRPSVLGSAPRSAAQLIRSGKQEGRAVRFLPANRRRSSPRQFRLIDTKVRAMRRAPPPVGQVASDS